MHKPPGRAAPPPPSRRPRAAPDEPRVKIVATLGPASGAPATLAALLDAGADVFRINGAHVEAGQVERLVRGVRAAARRVGVEVGVLLDLPGVKVRCGALPGGALEVVTGSLVELALGDAVRGGVVPVPPLVFHALAPGAEVLLADGTVALRVLERRGGRVRARVEAGGTIRDRVGVHVRGAAYPGAVLTRRDLLLARTGAAAGVDLLALSFVRGPDDVDRLRRHLARGRARLPLLVAKVERREAVETLDAVLAACDGVMVARGDLGLEYGPEEVPGLQKRILEAASRHGRFAITATQMLESMTTAARPTRAEASDVANAVFDGTDAVMLSGETAVGAHPAHVVATMNRIVAAAEADPHCPFAGDPRLPGPDADAARPDRLVVRAAVRLAMDAAAAAVVVFTRGGHSARRLAKERPRAPVYAYARDADVVRGLRVAWGVRPRLLVARGSTDELLRAVVRDVRREARLRPGDRVVLVLGGPDDPEGTTTLVKLVTL